MKKNILILLVALMQVSVFSQRMVELDGVMKPDALVVSEDQIFIVEGALCKVFSLEGKPIRTIGKRGEGPGELRVIPGFPCSVSVTNKSKIAIEGMNKIVYYSRKGKFLNEIKKYKRFSKTTPVGNNFVAIRMHTGNDTKKNYLELAIFNKEFKLLKSLISYEIADSDTEIEMIIDSIHYSVYQERVYVEDSLKGCHILIFNSNGVLVDEFNHKIDKIQICRKDKTMLEDIFKKDNFVRIMVKREGGWQNFKKKIKFVYPQYFPQIQDITVKENKIFILTHEFKDEKEKFLVMDLKGKIQKSLFLPVPLKASFLSRVLGRDGKFYGISSNIFYYLQENEEKEIFELGKITLN